MLNNTIYTAKTTEIILLAALQRFLT